MVTANILDPVHDTLDPTVWDAVTEFHPVLKPQHKDWVLSTIHDVLKNHGYGDMDKWLEVYLTGSLTTFQYSDESDCDISLFVNTDVFPEWSRAEMIALFVDEVDGTKLPGTTHPMQCFVVAKGIRPDDLYKPGLRSGYEILRNRWLVPPERNRAHDVEQEQNADYQWALEQADKMERLLRYEPSKAVTFWHQIHARRRRDQQAGKGDYAQSNIIYKFLANRGLFPQISDVSGEYIAKTAGKLEDFLMNPKSRPDLQTFEAQQWLQYLKSLQGEVGDKLDPLTPWLTREWKKGRLTYDPRENNHPTYQAPIPPHQQEIRGPETQYRNYFFNPPVASHWADWYGSNHPTRRGVDVMQMKMPDMHSRIRDWDAAMEQEAEERRKLSDPTLRGEVAHSWPDGWTVQKLTSEPSLKYEGDQMGHCVGGYGNVVNDGHTMIYSLRDPKNIPHVTAELTPQRFAPPDLEEAIAAHPIGSRLPDETKNVIRKVHELKQREKDMKLRDRTWTQDKDNVTRDDYPYDADWDQLETEKDSLPDPEGGDWYELHKSIMQAAPKHPLPHGADVEQIQGQGNTIPKPEYQARMKDFFNTFADEDKPKWNGNHINSYDEIDNDMGGYTAHGDYGIEGNNDYDWSSLITDAATETWTSPNIKIDKIVDHAVRAGEVDKAIQEANWAMEEQRRDFKDREWQRVDDEDIANWAGLEREDFMKNYDPDEWGDDDVPEGQEFDEERWKDAIDHERDAYLEDKWDHSEESEFFWDLDRELYRARQEQQRRQRTDPFAHVGAVQAHRNYSTGQPCKCTFTKHIRISKQAGIMPNPDKVEEARKRLNLQHPVRFLPTYRDVRGGYAGLTRDPQTDQESHLIFFNPTQNPGAKNWSAWHELAHALQWEQGGPFAPTSDLPDEEYAQLPKEHDAEAIAEKHADLDLWKRHSNTKGLNVGQEAQLTSQQTSAQARSVRGAHRQAQAVGAVSGNLWTMPDAVASEADDNRPHHSPIDGWDALLR